MTSLVILIILTHPSSNSSRVHLSFFSTGGGFVSAVDRENMIGVVVLLLLIFLDREEAGFSVSKELVQFLNREASVSEFLLLLLLLNIVSEEPFLLIFLDKGVVGIGSSVSELLLLLILLDSGVVDRLDGLVFANERGVGVLLLLLALLEKKEGRRVKKPSSSF
jgi:hypothetical protein